MARLKGDKRRTPSSRAWLERQLSDPYVARAKREGYRSRAAFKLAEIDDKFHFLKKGARVRLNGLGILQVRKRAARMGRNPATGEAIKIKASKKVAFRAAKELKQSI